MNKIGQPKVSIIIPTYNRATYVPRAIDSVLGQTYKNYEIIVVDDGSNDGTKELLQNKYADRIRYIYQNNAGPAAARNTAINAARYELIAFLDSDDIWLPRKLEMQLPSMLDPQIVLSFTNSLCENSAHDGCLAIKELDHETNTKVIEYPLRFVIRISGYEALLSSWICKKEALRRIGNFDEGMRIAEDTAVLYKLAAEGSFAMVCEPLLVKRIHYNEQLTNLKSMDYRKEHANNVVGILLETYSRSFGYPSDIQRELRRLISYFLVQQSKHAALDGNYNLARRKACESFAYSPKGKVALKALVGLISPALYQMLRRKY
jgi:glycosyltransferase involved in cell wall biosynthesis